MGEDRHFRNKECGCKNTNEIVYPVRENVEHICSEETVRHIHPSHTTVVNHHTIRNEHFYPETRSYEREVNETNVHGVQDRRDNDVRGASFSERDRGSHCNKCGRGDCSGKCGNRHEQHHCRRHHRRSWI